MYACMYVCVYICVCTYIYIYIYIYIPVYVHTSKRIYAKVYAYFGGSQDTCLFALKMCSVGLFQSLFVVLAHIMRHLTGIPVRAEALLSLFKQRKKRSCQGHTFAHATFFLEMHLTFTHMPPRHHVEPEVAHAAKASQNWLA